MREDVVIVEAWDIELRIVLNWKRYKTNKLLTLAEEITLQTQQPTIKILFIVLVKVIKMYIFYNH